MPQQKSPIRWPAEAVWEAVAPLLPGFTVEVLPSIDSTSSELMRRARSGLLDPVLLTAEEQTAGRGRLGKGWHSRPGQSLTFSIALPLAPASWSGLSLAVGVSLAHSLHPDIRLKWPNDLWWQGRKLAGILVETASGGAAAAAADATRTAIVGIGVNIAPLDGAGFATPPAWLQALLPGVDAPGALLRIAVPLVHALRAFEATGFAPLAERFAARDLLAGQPVQLSDGSQGVAEGVGLDGALRVRGATGLREVRSAEVSVRPAPPGAPG